MKTYGGVPRIFKLHSGWRWVDSVTIQLFCLRVKIPSTTGQEAGWAPELAFTRHWRKIIASAKNRTQFSDCPAHSQVSILTITSGFTVYLVILLTSSFPFCFVCSSLRCNTSKQNPTSPVEDYQRHFYISLRFQSHLHCFEHFLQVISRENVV
jgi:hypothetical protein